MSHRTQITLEDAQYSSLLRESNATGLSLAELVRRAIDQTYGAFDSAEFDHRMDISFGAWSDRDDDVDGETYVDQIRPARADRFAR